MGKQVSIQSHTDGDNDGLGCARGFFTCLLLEAAALITFGVGLYFFWGGPK